MSLQRVYKSLWRVVVVLARWPVRRWLHRRCLRRIELLEHELFPEWFGYVRMNAPDTPRNFVQIFKPYVSSESQRKLLLRNDDIRPVFNYVDDATQTVKQELLENELVERMDELSDVVW